MIRDDVIDRIQKLLRLAKSDNPNEAAVAADRARELMLAHDLETADLADIRQSVREETVGKRRAQIKTWEKELFDAVARHHDCKALFIRWTDHHRARHCAFDLTRTTYSMSLIGRSADVQVARYVFAFLLRQVARLAKEYRAQRPRIARRTLDSYRLGVVLSAVGKLQYMRQRDERLASEPGTALVLAKDAAIDEYLQQQGMKIEHGKRRAIRQSAAMRDGYLSGLSIDINPAVSTSDGRAALPEGGR
jgi:hypothetical protein